MAKPPAKARAPTPEVQQQTDDEGPAQLLAAMMVQQQSRSGPLPSAEEFARYAAVSPHAADAIVQYMIAEQAHRHAMDQQEQAHAHAIADRITDEGIRASKSGQRWFGSLAALAIAAGVACAVLEQTWPAGLFAVTAPIMIGRDIIMGWFRGGNGKRIRSKQPPGDSDGEQPRD